MNGTTLAIIGLRAAALALIVSGESKAGANLNLLADLVEAGRVTDAHMAEVAQKLKSGSVMDADWDELFARIDADRKRLHSS